MNPHVCTLARWAAILFAVLPGVALAGEVAGVAPPGSGEAVSSYTWPTAFVAAAVALRGVKLPPLVVQVNVKDGDKPPRS